MKIDGFLFVSLLYGKVGFINEPLTFYRQHKNNTWGIISNNSLTDYINRSFRLILRENIYIKTIKKYLVKNKKNGKISMIRVITFFLLFILKNLFKFI